MRTLFVKMFLLVWLASTVAGLVSFALGTSARGSRQRQNSTENQLRHARPLLQLLPLYGSMAATGLERDGTVPLFAAGERNVPGAVALHLFSEDGTPLSAKAPPELVAAAQQFAEEGASAEAPHISSQNRTYLVALRVAGPSGRPYIAAGLISSSPPRNTLGAFIPPDIRFRIAVSFVILGFACYLLTWWITRPIRQLRITAQRLAEGDLSARVSLKEIIGNSTEMVDLGEDFNRMAERIEQLIAAHKQLVRDVSHELRSPLARLNLALGRARQDDGAALQPALDRIELESERLNFLIGDLLTLSLLEGGGDALSKAVFPLCDLAEEVTTDADFEAASRNRQVLLLSCEPTTIVGNRELLRRALENIVRNGVRYTAEGTAVELNLGRTGNGQALLRVRDHGPGVPESALENIFRPFYRVAEDRGRDSGGAGVGLAIAERTVRLSGGTIHARNAPGGGLEIEMRLPLAEAA